MDEIYINQRMQITESEIDMSEMVISQTHHRSFITLRL
jgi:hypothetical protein